MISWRHRPLLVLLWLLGRAGEPGCLHRSAHAAADKGRARVRRRRGDGRCCRGVGGAAVLLCLTTSTRQTQTLQYWSLLSLPSITEYKALAAAYLRSPSPRHGYIGHPDLHLSISRPSTAVASVHSVQPSVQAAQHHWHCCFAALIALTTLKLRFFYHQSSAKLHQPYLCLVQLSLSTIFSQGPNI